MGKKIKTQDNSNSITTHKTQTKTKHTKHKKDLSNEVEVLGVDKKYLALVVVLALIAGYLHSQHVSSMFERQRFFSHLSTLERELSFRTEMGLYYSYYKTIAEASSFTNGLSQIIKCNVTEYPDEINVLRRFNLYPELVLGGFFRTYHWFAKLMSIKTHQCYSINRGNDLSSVQSCEGMGDIAHFYVFPIFWLSGLQISLFFLMATYMSGTVVGGIVAVAAFFFNHGECTRVMWTPPLRESFSFPFLMGQMLVVVHLLKCPKPNFKHSIMLAAMTALFMLPWQFAQFALLTQVCALFGLYALKFITGNRFSILLYGLLLAHGVNFVLQFANTLLVSSFFMSAMIASLVIVKLEKVINKLPHQLLIWITQGGMFVVLSVVIKVGTAKIFQIKDDAHIFDILKSKFTDFQNFHTLLYVCAPEFDFIGYEFFIKISHTLLFPCAVFVALVIVLRVLRGEWLYWFKSEELKDVKDEDESTKPFVVHLYVLLQTIAFMIMSIMIMRLKLFGSPALCLLASMIASRELFGFIGKKLHQYSVVFLILGLMTIQGYSNLDKEWKMKGEYTNAPLESMVEWINANTKSNDVFAGAMPTMAAIKLSCGRPIVNHPHYEDVGIRARTKRVYQLYSRKPVEHVYEQIKEMGVTYVVMEDSWCTRSTRVGCSLPETWDVEDPKNRGKRATCATLKSNPYPFTVSYKNNVYTILKI